MSELPPEVEAAADKTLRVYGSGRRSISVALSPEVGHALERIVNIDAFVEAALSRALRLPEGPANTKGGARNSPKPRRVGRPVKATTNDLAGCLAARPLSTDEFRRMAREGLDIPTSTFYRLLRQGERDGLFRHNMVTNEWKPLFPNSQNERGGHV